MQKKENQAFLSLALPSKASMKVVYYWFTLGLFLYHGYFVK